MSEATTPENVGTPVRTRIEIPTLTAEKEALGARIIGQEEAVDEFALLIGKLQSSIKPGGRRPIDIKFLAGPSGVGKTEITEALADELEHKGHEKIIKLNGGEYQQEHSISRLFGAPPGYRGSEDPDKPGSGANTIFSQENLDAHKIHYTDNAGNKRDVVVILVDEAEKANEAVHRAFLSVLDKGEIEMANNRKSTFTNAVIIYTSNVGNAQAEVVRENLRESGSSEAHIQKESRGVMERAFKSAFPPEFQGRIDRLILFKNLDKDALEKIISLRVDALQKDLAANGLKVAIELSDAAQQWVIDRGYNTTEGARSLKKVVASSIYDPLVLAHDDIEGGLHRKEIYVDVDPGNPTKLAYYFNEKPLPDWTEAEKAALTAARFTEDTPGAEGKGAAGADSRSQSKQDVSSIPEVYANTLLVILAPTRDEGNVERYLGEVKRLVRNGSITAEQAAAFVNSERVLQSAALYVWRRATSSGFNQDAYERARDAMIRAGIETKEEWDKWIVEERKAQDQIR